MEVLKQGFVDAETSHRETETEKLTLVALFAGSSFFASPSLSTMNQD